MVTGRVALVVAACVLAVVAGVSGRAAFGHHGSISDPERAAALKAAHQVQQGVDGTFLVATYRPDAGEHAASNTGHDCTRGHTVLVRLVWKADASFLHGGVPGAPPDGPRKALIVTADATTGTPCLIGASYAHVRPRRGETYLYGPRQDLVSPR